MKQFSRIALALFMSGMLFSSCEKSETQPGGIDNGSADALKGASMMDVMKSPAFAKAVFPYFQQAAQAKGAKFIMPLGTGDGFFILKDIVVDTTGPVPMIVDGELGGFTADLDDNDFWRENPDGSVSIHVSSNAAHGEHLNFGSGELRTGEQCNLSMNYTGYLMEICFPGGPNGELICFTVFDFGLGKNAVSWSGTGMVKLNGTGPASKLSAKVKESQGGNSLVTMELK